MQLLRVGPTALSSVDRLRTAALNLRGYSSRRVATEHGPMHVLEGRGHGPLPALVLIHGLSATASDYGPLLDRVRGVAKRIIVPDLPGHGQSATPEAGHADVLWDTLQQTLDQMLDAPALVFGNSLGGLAAIRYATRNPDRVRGLVLASPGGAPMSEEETRSLRRSFAVRSHQDARAFIAKVFPRPHWSHDIVAWGAGHRMRRPVVGRILAGLDGDQLLTPAELDSLTMPTLLLWGQEERVLPPSGIEFFQRHLPNHARIERPERFGHAPFVDRPREVAQYIRDFATELD